MPKCFMCSAEAIYAIKVKTFMGYACEAHSNIPPLPGNHRVALKGADPNGP